MTQNMNELKKEIKQKNFMLSAFSKDGNSENEKIRKVKIELDGLLYQYYKLLRCS